jgi:hypothetical protein
VILYRSGVLRPAAVVASAMGGWPALAIIDDGQSLVFQIDQLAAGGTVSALALDRITALDVIEVIRVGLDMSLGELDDEHPQRQVLEEDNRVYEPPRAVKSIDTGGRL